MEVQQLRRPELPQNCITDQLQSNRIQGLRTGWFEECAKCRCALPKRRLGHDALSFHSTWRMTKALLTMLGPPFLPSTWRVFSSAHLATATCQDCYARRRCFACAPMRLELFSRALARASASWTIPCCPANRVEQYHGHICPHGKPIGTELTTFSWHL